MTTDSLFDSGVVLAASFRLRSRVSLDVRSELWPLEVKRHYFSNSAPPRSGIILDDLLFTLVLSCEFKKMYTSQTFHHTPNTQHSKERSSAAVFTRDLDHVVLIIPTEDSVAKMLANTANTAVHTLQEKRRRLLICWL